MPSAGGRQVGLQHRPHLADETLAAERFDHPACQSGVDEAPDCGRTTCLRRGWRASLRDGLAALEAVPLGAADLGRALLRVGVVALPGSPGPTRATPQIDIRSTFERHKPSHWPERFAALASPVDLVHELIEIRVSSQFARREQERVCKSKDDVGARRPAPFEASNRPARDA